MGDSVFEGESTPLLSHKSLRKKEERYSSVPDEEQSRSFVARESLKPKFLQNSFVFEIMFVISLLCVLALLWLPWSSSASSPSSPAIPEHPSLQAGWTSNAAPISTVDPTTLGFVAMERPWTSLPGPIFGDLRTRGIALPTNSWYENLLLGENNVGLNNKVFQVPYIIDTGARIPGVRSHPCHVQANTKMVMMNYELDNGATLGAVNSFDAQHTVHSQGTPAITKLAIELSWQNSTSKSSMRSPIVRGSPYTSMIYFHSTPRILFDRHLKSRIIIDRDPSKNLECGEVEGVYSKNAVRVEKELRVEIDTSDMTWLILLSEPLEFICSNYNVDLDMQRRGEVLAPGVVSDKKSYFDLQATTPMELGMVRLAMVNNCTSGQNAEYCGPSRKPRDQSEYEDLIRKHADIFPTAKADIEFSFPYESPDEQELRLVFNWRPKLMSRLKSYVDLDRFDMDNTFVDATTKELLMFALPHHQERMRPVFGSSNTVLEPGCMPTIHGMACPALGESWSLIEHLHRTSFYAARGIRGEMESDVRQAAKEDLHWRLPRNYMVGAGDTYFSGKMLARLARVLLISDQLGLKESGDFQDALSHLRSGVEIWLNGSAQSVFLYDNSWGGVVMCGCDYAWENNVGFCRNQWPNCPALFDQGLNFGAGFYNDHHFHYGYHIYAAAVLSKFDAVWGRKWHQHVLLLIRDIANPSNEDKFFPTWRHKDWYLGFSWASGVVTVQAHSPYPNGRNQESVSEAIAAYEAVALYGDAMSEIFFYSGDEKDHVLRDNALRIRDIGRLLMATEVRSAKTYWQVRAPNTPGVSRVYPDIFEPKAMGMIWSMIAQLQTWFGLEEWKAYGIQLLPITVVSELRDDPHWVKEMLPSLETSCFNDPSCVREGWSIGIFTSWATIGRWREAWEATKNLSANVFESAGGNGHSMSNTLWYISTRPDVELDG